MKSSIRKMRKERVDAGFRAYALKWVEQMRLATIRPTKQTTHDIYEIAKDVLLEDGRLSVEELERRLINVNHIPPRQAVAEVKTFADQSIRRLRHRVLPLMYPVTKWGFEHPDEIDPNDGASIRKATPWGSGNSIFGWVLASTVGDPVYAAYQRHSVASANGIIKQVNASTAAAVEAGVLPADHGLLGMGEA